MKREKSNKQKLKENPQKNYYVSKRTFAFTGLAITLGSSPFILSSEPQFFLGICPSFSKPFGSDVLSYGIGGSAKLSIRPVKFIDFYGKCEYLSLPYAGGNSLTLLSGTLGTGYHFEINERVSLNAGLELGAYNAKSINNKMNGIVAGGSITLTYRINPVASTAIDCSFNHYAGTPKPLLNGGEISPGLSLNLNELFSKKPKIEIKPVEILPIFPVLYSWYEDNPFGTVEIINSEDSKITDIVVSFYQPQYMSQANICAHMDSLQPGESFNAELIAFFNESMLELTELSDTKATVFVEYSYLGQKRLKEYPVTVPVYNRNAMSWDDDRRASVFVSSKDPAALWFAKYVTSIVRSNIRNGVPTNIQYAMGIFETLDQFGLNYVVDPTSAYADNVGQTSIDFLQFPYQTLMYRGGDCDDLSILVSSLFEAVGIHTGFITVPGHIYMAFDTGLTSDEAENEFVDMSQFIVKSGKVWMPLEITLTDEGFNKAWRIGAREWNTASRSGEAEFFEMTESWKTYKPVSVPGAASHFSLPDRNLVAKSFQHRLDEWILREITPQIDEYSRKLAENDSVVTRNSLGVLYGKYGLFIQADEQFRKGRKKNYLPSYLNTANIFFARQEYVKALEWYKKVLVMEPNNEIAVLGIARCSYELEDYSVCDRYYSKLIGINVTLANRYLYLGSFIHTEGRSFSLADRLSGLEWSDPANKKQNSQSIINVTSKKVLILPKDITEESEEQDDSQITGLNSKSLMLIPDSPIDKQEEQNSDLTQDPLTSIELTNQNLNKINLEDEDLTPPTVKASDNSIVSFREVPRFSEQPSQKWAPEAAYKLETIPGMLSYAEEMGDYVNDKSYLYTKSEDEIGSNKETQVAQIKTIVTPKANPIDSYFDQKAIEEAKKQSISIKQVTTINTNENIIGQTDIVNVQQKVKQPITEQPTIVQTKVEQPTIVQTKVEQPTIEQPTIVQTKVEQPIIEQQITEQTKVEQPTIVQTKVEQSTIEQPTIEQPTIEQPNIEQVSITSIAVDIDAVESILIQSDGTQEKIPVTETSFMSKEELLTPDKPVLVNSSSNDNSTYRNTSEDNKVQTDNIVAEKDKDTLIIEEETKTKTKPQESKESIVTQTFSTGGISNNKVNVSNNKFNNNIVEKVESTLENVSESNNNAIISENSKKTTSKVWIVLLGVFSSLVSGAIALFKKKGIKK